jgi:hypothetical protein
MRFSTQANHTELMKMTRVWMQSPNVKWTCDFPPDTIIDGENSTWTPTGLAYYPSYGWGRSTAAARNVKISLGSVFGFGGTLGSPIFSDSFDYDPLVLYERLYDLNIEPPVRSAYSSAQVHWVIF